MPADDPIPWENGRRRDLEAVMADEVPDFNWHVREFPTPFARQGFMVSTDVGVHRYVRGLTKETARTLAHELALAVRLRDG